jgi:ribulose-5-phosphate 4-epimerase/fuculose-1-phosphate aldolase
MKGDTMTDVPDQVLHEFLQACHKAAGRGLMRCSSGSLSRRLDDTRLLATSSGSWMEDISEEELSVCRILDHTIVDGPKPTIEIGFHAEILRTRADVNVVMHFQTPFATARACRGANDTNYFVIPEIPFYIGHVARVPYLLPGSKELAEAVAGAMQDHDMVIMSNHGMVTVAADYGRAIQNAEFFELACEIITYAGDMLRPMPEEDVKNLLAIRQAPAKEV